MIRDMAKYYRIDPKLRAARQAEWNRPVGWPIVLMVLALLAILWTGWRGMKARERATARRPAMETN